jgi:hypothetical protein
VDITTADANGVALTALPPTEHPLEQRGAALRDEVRAEDDAIEAHKWRMAELRLSVDALIARIRQRNVAVAVAKPRYCRARCVRSILRAQGGRTMDAP